MKEFQQHCESRYLLVATSGDISTKMAYIFPSNTFSNVESVIFLLKRYFEGFPIEIFLAFKITCFWGDQKKNFLTSGNITLKTAIHHDGWMSKDFRNELQKQFLEIVCKDYSQHINMKKEANVC